MNATDLSQIYRDRLAKSQPGEYKFRRILTEHHLSVEGTLKRVMDVIIESTVDGLEFFRWRVPVIEGETATTEIPHVTAVKVVPNLKMKNYRAYHEVSEQLDVIEIQLEPLAKGGTVHLQFEYYISNACIQSKPHLLGLIKEMKYPFAHRTESQIDFFEMRIHLPNNTDPIVENVTNIPNRQEVIFNNEHVITSKGDNLSNADLLGTVSFNVKSDHFYSVYLSILGLVFTLLIAITQNYSDSLGGFSYLVMFLSFLVVSGVSLRLFGFKL